MDKIKQYIRQHYSIKNYFEVSINEFNKKYCYYKTSKYVTTVSAKKYIIVYPNKYKYLYLNILENSHDIYKLWYLSEQKNQYTQYIYDKMLIGYTNDIWVLYCYGKIFYATYSTEQGYFYECEPVLTKELEAIANRMEAYKFYEKMIKGH